MVTGIVYSGGSYYRHLRGVLIEDLVTFRQDSRSRDYGNDDAESCTLHSNGDVESCILHSNGDSLLRRQLLSSSSRCINRRSCYFSLRFPLKRLRE